MICVNLRSIYDGGGEQLWQECLNIWESFDLL